MNAGIGNVKGKIESGELLTTTTSPTESDGVITISTSDISGTPKVNNYLAYIDSDNITALYKITNISSGTATLSLIGNVGGSGGGKQLYQHNIKIIRVGTGDKIKANVSIINDSPTAFNYSSFKGYITTMDSDITLIASGICIYDNKTCFVYGLVNGTQYTLPLFLAQKQGDNTIQNAVQEFYLEDAYYSDSNITDIVIAL